MQICADVTSWRGREMTARSPSLDPDPFNSRKNPSRRKQTGSFTSMWYQAVAKTDHFDMVFLLSTVLGQLFYSQVHSQFLELQVDQYHHYFQQCDHTEVHPKAGPPEVLYCVSSSHHHCPPGPNCTDLVDKICSELPKTLMQWVISDWNHSSCQKEGDRKSVV